jgi:hypothetical protein
VTINIDIEVETGPIVPIPVPVTAVDIAILNAPCKYYGFSLREASGDIPRDNQGTVTSPAAGATIATLAGLAAGNYTVSWVVGLAGTLAAPDANNFQLTVTGSPAEPSINLAVAGEYPQVNAEVTVPASGTISIQAIGIGTVGAVYTAQLAIQPSLVDEAQVEIRDGNQPLGECGLGIGGSETEYTGPPGIKVRNSITLHVVQGTVTGVVYCTLGY